MICEGREIAMSINNVTWIATPLEKYDDKIIENSKKADDIFVK